MKKQIRICDVCNKEIIDKDDNIEIRLHSLAYDTDYSILDICEECRHKVSELFNTIRNER